MPVCVCACACLDWDTTPLQDRQLQVTVGCLQDYYSSLGYVFDVSMARFCNWEYISAVRDLSWCGHMISSCGHGGVLILNASPHGSMYICDVRGSRLISRIVLL